MFKVVMDNGKEFIFEKGSIEAIYPKLVNQMGILINGFIGIGVNGEVKLNPSHISYMEDINEKEQ